MNLLLVALLDNFIERIYEWTNDIDDLQEILDDEKVLPLVKSGRLLEIIENSRLLEQIVIQKQLDMDGSLRTPLIAHLFKFFQSFELSSFLKTSRKP